MNESELHVANALVLKNCRELCAWVQRREAVAVWLWLGEMLPILQGLRERMPRLAARGGAMLPAVPDEVKFEVFERLMAWLGDTAHYWLEGDNEPNSTELSGNLADDVADIYCEVEPVINMLDAGQIDEPTALSMLYRGFALHWGQHVRDAERYLLVLTAARRFSN
jgi:hypothetical protein